MLRAGSMDLIKEVEESLEIMRESLQIKPVKVKSMLEHLRSALEYLANDTYDIYVNEEAQNRPKVYFPFGEQKFIDNFFIKKLGVNPPSSTPLYEIFNSIQDFKTGENWLGMMCNLTNEVKHRKPIPLKEEDVVTGFTVNTMGVNLVQADHSSSVTLNAYINGVKISDFTLKDGELHTSNNGAKINLTLTKEKKIKFHGVEHEVIPFIQLCAMNIKSFINEAYDALEILH